MSAPQDQKKEEFKQYLDKAGVLELLTSSLVKLYEEPEKPNDALEYLKNNIGGSKTDKEEIAKLTSENDDLKKKIEVLERKEAELKEKLTEVTALKGPEMKDKLEEMAVADAPVDNAVVADASVDNKALTDEPTVTAAMADAPVNTADTKMETPAATELSTTDENEATDGEKKDVPMEEEMETEDVPAPEPATATPVIDEKAHDTEPNEAEDKKAAEEAPKDADSLDN